MPATAGGTPTVWSRMSRPSSFSGRRATSSSERPSNGRPGIAPAASAIVRARSTSTSSSALGLGFDSRPAIAAAPGWPPRKAGAFPRDAVLAEEVAVVRGEDHVCVVELAGLRQRPDDARDRFVDGEQRRSRQRHLIVSSASWAWLSGGRDCMLAGLSERSGSLNDAVTGSWAPPKAFAWRGAGIATPPPMQSCGGCGLGCGWPPWGASGEKAMKKGCAAAARSRITCVTRAPRTSVW